ncbi:MAG: DUF6166 domain-containing protein [Vicinamibacterales bacterium]
MVRLKFKHDDRFAPERSSTDMKVYVGERLTDGSCRVYIEQPETPRVRLYHRSSGVSHSPTGFEWGYGGSGPAELARALVKDVTGDQEPPAHLYQRFKFRVVGALPQAGWRLSEDEIREHLEALAEDKNQKGDSDDDEAT